MISIKCSFATSPLIKHLLANLCIFNDQHTPLKHFWVVLGLIPIVALSTCQSDMISERDSLGILLQGDQNSLSETIDHYEGRIAPKTHKNRFAENTQIRVRNTYVYMPSNSRVYDFLQFDISFRDDMLSKEL